MTTTHNTTSNASVKWFNTKKGFGFLTDCTSGLDIFVHRSALNVPDNVYRKLITGEYVQYELSTDDSGKQLALNVTGIQGGNLLCQLDNARVVLINNKDGVNQSSRPKRHNKKNNASYHQEKQLLKCPHTGVMAVDDVFCQRESVKQE